jgi:peptidase YpeB-like protein
MTRNLLVGAIAVGALALTAGTAFALSSDDGPTPGAASVTSSLTETTSTSTSEPTSSPSSSAPTSTSDTPTTAPAPAGTLTAADAGRIAVARMGGTAHEIEREVEHGRVEWKVEITARDGNTYDVRIDATSGAITRVDQDTRGGRDDNGTRGTRGTDDNGRNGNDDRGVDDDGGHGNDDRGGDDRGGDDNGGHGGRGGDDD